MGTIFPIARTYITNLVGNFCRGLIYKCGTVHPIIYGLWMENALLLPFLRSPLDHFLVGGTLLSTKYYRNIRIRWQRLDQQKQQKNIDALTRRSNTSVVRNLNWWWAVKVFPGELSLQAPRFFYPIYLTVFFTFLPPPKFRFISVASSSHPLTHSPAYSSTHPPTHLAAR